MRVGNTLCMMMVLVLLVLTGLGFAIDIMAMAMAIGLLMKCIGILTGLDMVVLLLLVAMGAVDA